MPRAARAHGCEPRRLAFAPSANSICEGGLGQARLVNSRHRPYLARRAAAREGSKARTVPAESKCRSRVRSIMPAGLPRPPRLAMKLWLAQRLGRTSSTAPSASGPGHAPGTAMSLGSIERLLQNRVRTFLRNVWAVTILGTIILGGAVSLAFYYMTGHTTLRIAAGPDGGIDAGFVQLMAKEFAKQHDKVDIRLITTSGPTESARAIVDHKADLAILPSTIGKSPDWPVVAVLRQNVMALIVPASSVPGAPGAGPKTAPQPAKTTEPDKNTTDKDTADKTDDDAKTGDADKLTKVAQLTGRRIGIVTGNEASADLLRIVLGHYGVPVDKVHVSDIDPHNLSAAIRDNKRAAIFVAGPATGHAITDAVTAATNNGVAPTFIAIDQAEGI